MTENYSNREIDHYFLDIKKSLNRIEAQTIKTNGRVNKLESWKSLLVGCWIVTMTLVIPLLVAWANVSIQHLDEKITHLRND
jgi:hypothetical protein